MNRDQAPDRPDAAPPTGNARRHRPPRWVGTLALVGLLLPIGAWAQAEGGVALCVDGTADGALCEAIDRLAAVSTAAYGTVRAVEAWTDPVTGTEYALAMTEAGTNFYDLSDPTDPLLVAQMLFSLDCCLAYTTGATILDDHAFVIGFLGDQDREAQVFDLNRLRAVVSPPEVLEHDGVYSGFNIAWSVSANPETGFLYVGGADTCSGGLHIIDASDLTEPVEAGCYDAWGEIAMAQCVLYQGPDVRYQGREICFAANEDALLILDVGDKTQPVVISRSTYSGSNAVHGSLTEGHVHFLLADSEDEIGAPHPTRTYLWNLNDLEAPTFEHHDAATVSRDLHNTVRGQHVYQANLSAGVRILDLHDLADGSLDEVAFFDSIPNFDIPATFNGGAWDLALTDSGLVLVAGFTPEFQVLAPDLCTDPPSPTQPTVQSTVDNTLQIDWTGEPGVSFDVYRSTGACPGEAPERVASGLTSSTFTDTVAGQLEHSYVVTATEATGRCESVPSPCGSATATGPCDAPPIFEGLRQVDNPQASLCRVDLAWDPATPRCGSEVSYAVYRGDTPDFVPSSANRIATALGGTTYSDFGVDFEETSYYIVRALDTSNGQEDGNTTALAGSPVGPAISAPWTAGAEAGDPEFGYPDGDLGWRVSTEDAQSGTASYHSGSGQRICSPLISPPLKLPADEAAMLTFWTRYNFFNQGNGGVVEISEDGGATWIDHEPVGGYPSTLFLGNECGYPLHHPAYTDDSGWQEETFDLTSWAGQEILIRWVYASPPANFAGWFVDEITVSHVEQPQACTPLLFGDGFESGDTSFWSSTNP